MTNVIDICRQKGIAIQEVEPKVYQNITIDIPVNIDILKRAINNCTLFVSEGLQQQRTKEGYTTTVAKVYYILLGTEDRDKIKALYTKVKKEHPKVYISKFNDSKPSGNDVLTIFGPEEVCD